MKKTIINNPDNYVNLLNLLNLVFVTNQPIIVHDEDCGEDYDITEMIKAARTELGY